DSRATVSPVRPALPKWSCSAYRVARPCRPSAGSVPPAVVPTPEEHRDRSHPPPPPDRRRAGRVAAAHGARLLPGGCRRRAAARAAEPGVPADPGARRHRAAPPPPRRRNTARGAGVHGARGVDRRVGARRACLGEGACDLRGDGREPLRGAVVRGDARASSAAPPAPALARQHTAVTCSGPTPRAAPLCMPPPVTARRCTPLPFALPRGPLWSRTP